MCLWWCLWLRLRIVETLAREAIRRSIHSTTVISRPVRGMDRREKEASTGWNGTATGGKGGEGASGAREVWEANGHWCGRLDKDLVVDSGLG
jgi:hypothetical protein